MAQIGASVHSTSAGPCAPAMAVQYHDSDFDWEEAKAEYDAVLHQLQQSGSAMCEHDDPLQSTELGQSSTSTDKCDAELVPPSPSPWEQFHATHATARFFKPRRYLLHAFPVLADPGIKVLELGCGAGASLLPILVANPTSRCGERQKSWHRRGSCSLISLSVCMRSVFSVPSCQHKFPPHHLCSAVGLDVSPSALGLLRTAAAATEASDRISTAVHDLEGPQGAQLPTLPTPPASTFDAVLLIFTLSALSDQGVANALRAAHAALRPGGRLLVRDYAACDMAHLRFMRAAGKGGDAFHRGDGTLARFFSLQQLLSAAARLGFRAAEARYACTRLRRFGKPDEKRVFVHLVLEQGVECVPGSEPVQGVPVS